MPVVVLRLPDISTQYYFRPEKCPHCDSVLLQRWGQVKKPVRDPEEKIKTIYRYRCLECNKTFRHYPKGVDQATRTRRVRQLAALIWTLGLSYRDVSYIFDELGVEMSRSAIARTKQEISDDNTKELAQRYNIDSEYKHRISSKLGVVIAVDLGEEKFGILGVLDEDNPWVVKKWLESLAKETEIEVGIMGTGLLDHFQGDYLEISIDHLYQNYEIVSP